MRIIDSFLKIASCFVCLLLEVKNVNAQLVINVKNLGGDVLQETIWSNVTEDTVTLEFQRSDGTLVTQLVDFANDVQIMRVLMLGEEERGQSQYQVMCFLLYADKADFISPDAMGKLRQKNPGTVRSAEENRGTTETPLQLWVDLALVGVVSPHAPAFCAEARGAIYARRDDVIKWAERPGISVSQLMSAVTPFPDSATICAEEKSQRAPCTCRLEVCIGWFPCGLKYCKGRPQTGAVASQQNNYRCGIKTCRRCNGFSYHVRRKASCLFDD